MGENSPNLVNLFALQAKRSTSSHKNKFPRYWALAKT
jgi:hypothetical protein